MKTKPSARVRKLFVPATLSAAMAFASVGFSQSAAAANRQLELVPDDTAFYFGTGKPVAVEDFFAMVPDFFNPEAMGKWLPELSKSKADQEIFQSIGEFFKDPAKVTREWGLGDELQFSAFTLGLMPVLRIEGDSKKFESAIANMETKHEINFDKLSHKDIDVRIFAPKKQKPGEAEVVIPTASDIKAAENAVAEARAASDEAAASLTAATAKLDAAKESNDASGIAVSANEIADAANLIAELQETQSKAERELAKLKAVPAGEKSGPGIVIAADGDDLVFAFSYDAYDPQLLDSILGITKPEKSSEATGRVKEFRKQWGYGDELAAYVDLELVADAVTGGESTAATQIKSLMSTNDEMHDELNMLAAEPCRSEIRQYAAHMPMIVSGNRKFEVDDNRIEVDSHFAVLIKNEPLLDLLKLLRGVVPVSQSSSDAMMSFGVGIDVDGLPQMSSGLTDLLSNLNYSCEPLAGINALGNSDVSTLSMGAVMFSGMARGIKGFSVNLFDVDTDANPGLSSMPVNNVDAAIAIAAEDPGSLLSTMRILPQLGLLAELPLDGTPMSLNDSLPIPLPPEVKIFAAVKGKNIVLYSGEQSADFSNRISGEGKEGFLFTNFNTKKMMSKADSLIEALPDLMGSDDAMAMEMIKSYPLGNVLYKFDFTEEGFELETDTEFERPAKDE